MTETKDAEAGLSTSSQAHGTVDAALEYLRHEATTTLTTIDEKRLVRKIDYMIVPLLWLCYNLQYLDKTLVNYAKVMGLEDDTKITGNQFSYLALMFYITYLVFELPTGYAMQRLPTAKYLGANVAMWGLIVALNCTAHNFAGLVVLRVLLGVFESAVAPALILITSMWYKKSEQVPRMGLWYLGTGTGTIIGALASFGFQHYHADQFTSWQIMFLLFGLITIITGCAVAYFLPDNPMKARYLTHDEKIWAIERLRENQTGIENKHYKLYQAIECFKDPQTWLLSLITISSNVPNGAVSSFQATIIQGFGYTSEQTALLSIPSGFVAICSILTATFLGGHFNQRGIFIIMLLCPGLIGGCLMAFAPADNVAAKLAGNYLTNCIGATLPLLYSWVAANYAGHTKKVTMNAVLLMSFCLGNIMGPLTFQDKDAPDYIPAKIAIVVTVLVAGCTTAVLMFYYRWENKRRDRNGTGISDLGGAEDDSGFLDLTDRENVKFRVSPSPSIASICADLV